MPHAIMVEQPGGPEALQWREVPLPNPAPNEVVIKQTAIGLNYIDIYLRSGLYKAPQYPFVPGFEGAGVVIAVGSEVEFLGIGDRVAYGMGPLGAYSEFRAMPEEKLVKIPKELTDEQAAGMMLQGLTAQFLLRQTYRVHANSVILVQAAAGGVGLFLVQWAKALGATVIGTVGSAAKAEYVRDVGADYVINYTTENVPEAVRRATHRQGVDVVYDGVGQATFMDSLDCLRPLGMMVSFGQASGSVPPFDLGLLREKGSLVITRPSLFDYFRDAVSYQAAAGELIDVVVNRKLRLHILQSYYLQDAAFAHAEMEARHTMGKSVLVV